MSDLRAEVLRFADTLNRGTGSVAAVDVAWKLRQIAGATPTTGPAPAPEQTNPEQAASSGTVPQRFPATDVQTNADPVPAAADGVGRLTSPQLHAVLHSYSPYDSLCTGGQDCPAQVHAHGCALDPCGAASAGGPRVWRAGDPEPEDKPIVTDNDGARWEWRAEGDEPHPGYANQWHCLDDSGHMPWEFLARRWEPLTEVLDGKWRPGDVAYDRTGFVHVRYNQGWRTYPRTMGTQYGDDVMESHLGPLVRLAAVPPGTSEVGALPKGFAHRSPAAPQAPAEPTGRVWNVGDPEPTEDGLTLIDREMTPDVIGRYSDPTWFREGPDRWSGPYAYRLSWAGLLKEHGPVREYRRPAAREDTAPPDASGHRVEVHPIPLGWHRVTCHSGCGWLGDHGDVTVAQDQADHHRADTLRPSAPVVPLCADCGQAPATDPLLTVNDQRVCGECWAEVEVNGADDPEEA